MTVIWATLIVKLTGHTPAAPDPPVCVPFCDLAATYDPVIDPVTTVLKLIRSLQDNGHTTSNPCIALLGGENVPSQLHKLPTDQESKKFYPLDTTGTAKDSLHSSPSQNNVELCHLTPDALDKPLAAPDSATGPSLPSAFMDPLDGDILPPHLCPME